VQDGKTGLLTPAGQPDKLAEAMQRMLIDTELRHIVIPAARQTVAQAFDNRRLIRELAEVYRSEGIGLMIEDR